MTTLADPQRCRHHADFGDERVRCELEAKHKGPHRNGEREWQNRGDL